MTFCLQIGTLVVELYTNHAPKVRCQTLLPSMHNTCCRVSTGALLTPPHRSAGSKEFHGARESWLLQ